MDKTININLGGSLFQIDEEAFPILRDYLQSVNSRFSNVQGGNETIEDIESRIAEIFRSQKGLGGVISKDNVEAMISTIGRPEDFDTDSGEAKNIFSNPASQPHKRLYRNPDDSVISGVCGGLGVYLNTDPVLFRVLFVLFTLLGGAGVLIYLVLWIAVPSADNEPRKKEMYGDAFNSVRQAQSQGRSGLNEVVSAFGKALFVIFRIFMILFGICLVMTGFALILAFIVLFIIKYPGAFQGFDFNIVYLPEMLRHVVTEQLTVWIIILASIVILLPLIAIIYWGIRMIFWFRARNRYVNLTALILWVLSGAVLSIILFNEGMRFSESSVTKSPGIFPTTPDTLYIVTTHKSADLKSDKLFSLPDEAFNIILLDSGKTFCITPGLRLKIANDHTAGLEIRKHSSGRTRLEASEKSQSLVYNYKISGDTLYLDDYFSFPADKKWTADFITISLSLPINTILHFDTGASELFRRHIFIEKTEGDEVYDFVDYDNKPSDLPGEFWKLTDEGLRKAVR